MSGRFLDDKWRTPAQRAAAVALEALDDGLVGRTHAERMAPLSEKRAVQQWGKRTKGSKWWGWVPGRRGDDYRGLPGDDHVEHREKDGRRVHISQPYHLHWDELQGLVEHCKAHGLRADIHADSWYFPGYAIVVVVQRDAAADMG